MYFSELREFKAENINDRQKQWLRILANKARRDALRMIAGSGSGHPGGALSSIDIYIMLWLCAKAGVEYLGSPERDRIVVSHGHTSAGVYAVLGNLGHFDTSESISGFRQGGGIFEGHPCIKVPGVEWCSGSLGQGLSVGCGFALASKIKKQDYHVFVVMGDGEQAKGQISEAREFAAKYGLGNLTAVVDCNGLQASGSLETVMPQNLTQKYEAAGWKVIGIDGHDYAEIYDALRECYITRDRPAAVLARTVMGKGVPAIENNFEYHGRLLSLQQYSQAMEELHCEEEQELLENGCFIDFKSNCSGYFKQTPIEAKIKYGTPVIYKSGQMADCRSAFGEALYDIADANSGTEEVHIVALDCDLAESVKVQKFGSKYPGNLIECGIQEHNAATVAGALSKSGILTFYADFGVFGIDETYSQHRMSDFNNTSVKLVCTHNGLDVGEDGKTHQCIDYISLMSNLFGFRIIVPADANQTDRAVRYAATNCGNVVIGVGRSKLPILLKEDGSIFYDADYVFEYGNADWIRQGGDCAIITCGTLVNRAVKAWERLKDSGIDAGILNLSCPGKLDCEKLVQAARTGLVVTYEDHNVHTGIGSIVGSFLAENRLGCNFKRVGINGYGVSASPDYQYKLMGLDEDSLFHFIKQQIAELCKKD